MAEQIIKQYNAEAMELFKNIVENATAKGKPKFYEILVDNLKAVEKTSDAEEFGNYENFINNNSRQVEVRMYASAKSPKFDKHVFFIGEEAEKKEQGLSGTEIQNIVQRSIQVEREKWEKQRLENELKEKNDLLAESEKYIDDLESTISELKKNRNTIRGIDVGEMAGVALEALLRNNVHLLEKYPMTKSLAGIIARDNEQQKINLGAPQENAEVQFSSADNATALSEEDKQHVDFLKQLQTAFNQQEITDLLDIIGAFSKDHTQLKTVKELLQNNNN